MKDRGYEMTKFSKLIAAITMSATALTLPATAQAQDKYVGEIFQVGFNFCPQGSLEAAGQTVPITTNQALFALYGVVYGGDGQTTFALPDLRGRVAMGEGAGPGLTPRQMGQKAGTETNTLTVSQMPAHNHSPRISVARIDADSRNPINNSFARATGDAYIDNQSPDPSFQMSPGTVMSSNVGGNQPVSAMQPYLVTRFCVMTQGLFPPRP